MSIATVTSKGQITIPVDVRNSLKLEAGDRVNFFLEDKSGQVVFFPITKDVTSLKGIISKPETPVSIEDMNDAVTYQLWPHKQITVTPPSPDPIQLLHQKVQACPCP